jgi:hypothetical protein
MNRVWRSFARLGLVAFMPLLAGCGSPLGQASGKVTFNGEPVPLAEVGFEAKDDPRRQAFGTTGEAGTYTLAYPNGRGLPPGKYVVTVTRHTLPGGRPLPAGEKGLALLAEDGKTVSRPYYYEVDLQVGPNSHDFELTAGQDRRPGG